MFEWDTNAVSLRDVHSEQVSKLVKISGIAISSSSIRAKPGLEGFALPRKCPSTQPGGPQVARCPIDPFFIVPDKCHCVDFQTIKLQETPETVPHGEMPRHVLLYCDRYLCEQVVPGNRVTVVGVYCIRVTVANKRPGANERSNAGVRQPYIRVLGLSIDTEGPGRSALVSGGTDATGASATLTENQEEELISLANSPNIYDRLARSIAPSIYGSADIKKAIACLLFGGSRKRYV
ncbi:unnamed protein product [Trichobilharzia regenti]|nr:unnamed protein product [Trichobilharzia regenti]